MENLPNEILYKIFSHLNVFDQLNVSFACTTFEAIIQMKHLPRFLEIDTNMYATNIYYDNKDFLSLLDQVSERFMVKSIKITNKLHSEKVALVEIEEEIVFNFNECPDPDNWDQFSVKYDSGRDDKNLEKLIHSSGIAKIGKNKHKHQEDTSKDLFDHLKKKKNSRNFISQCEVCNTGNLHGRGLVQHLKSKSHNLLTNLTHKSCKICLENLWSSGILTKKDLDKSKMYKDLKEMISAKNKDIFGKNYRVLRSDGMMENLIVGLLVQTNFNTSIEAVALDVKMSDFAMLELFDSLRSFQNLKKLTMVDFGSDWSMGFLFYEFMKGHQLVCISLCEGEHDEAFRRFLDEEAQIGLDMQGVSMSSYRLDPDVPEATGFLADEFRSLHCTHGKDKSKYWTNGCGCGLEEFPKWYH